MPGHAPHQVTSVSAALRLAGARRLVAVGRLRDTAGWDVLDFDSGHDAMITRPLDLAAALVT